MAMGQWRYRLHTVVRSLPRQRRAMAVHLTPCRERPVNGYIQKSMMTWSRRVRVVQTFGHGHLAQCPEARADLFGEELRLFPGGEVAALVDLVVVDEVGVGPFGPAPRRLVLLARKDARGHRDGHALGIEEATLVFPIQTRRRDPSVRHPVERDVVEDLLTRQLARGARGPVQSRDDRRGRLAAGIIVVQKPGGQADG